MSDATTHPAWPSRESAEPDEPPPRMLTGVLMVRWAVPAAPLGLPLSNAEVADGAPAERAIEVERAVRACLPHAFHDNRSSPALAISFDVDNATIRIDLKDLTELFGLIAVAEALGYEGDEGEGDAG